MGRKLLSVLLVAAILLTMPVIAMGEAQEKSWDIKGENLYGMVCASDGYMTVANQGGEFDFGWIELWDTEHRFPEDMRGEWTIKKLDDTDMEVGMNSDGGAFADFHMIKCTVGQSSTFLVTYSSDDLQNDICEHVNVFVAPSGVFATGYEYDKTEHETKTGKRYHVAAGHATPVGAQLYRPITFDFYCDDTIWENGYVDFNYETGEFYVMQRQPGVYKVTVRVSLMENARFDIEHTINVSGSAVDDELPDEFRVELERYDIDRLYNEGDDGEKRINNYWTGDEWAWRNDEIEWSFEQTKGEKVNFYGRNFEDDNVNGESFIDGELPVGQYEFKITAKNITRGEEASATFKLAVEQDKPGELLPEMIHYKKIEQGSTVTIKSGKTLDFGKPILYPSNSAVPADHNFGFWIEDFDGNWDDVCVKEDRDIGAHILRGAKEGTYTVHAYLDMYGGSRGAEMIFTLVVEPVKAKVSSISFDKQGDWDNPYPIMVGKPTKIKATVLPKNAGVKTLAWESEWQEGVSVDQKGVVTGYEMGATVLIRARSTDGSDVEQYIVVRVVPQTVTKITIPKKLKMSVGDVKTITPKLKPANVEGDMRTLIWQSDNSTVAEVGRNSGEIIANAPGTATIYAYAIDGDYRANMKVFAKCKVTVK